MPTRTPQSNVVCLTGESLLKRLAILAIVLPLFGCSSDSNSILGTWRTPDSEMSQQLVKATYAEYTFRSDSTVGIVIYARYSPGASGSAVLIRDSKAYKLDANRLTIGNELWTVAIDGKHLRRTDGSGVVTVLTRVE